MDGSLVACAVEYDVRALGKAAVPHPCVPVLVYDDGRAMQTCAADDTCNQRWNNEGMLACPGKQ